MISKSTISSFFLVVTFCIFFGFQLQSQVKLPRLVSDGMVLQRNTEVKIWGWADAGEDVTVEFLDKNYITTANKNGEWFVLLDKMEAGGPYSMEIIASNSIVLEDILIGDVWICSGQSNMELPMRRVSWVYPDEIKNSKNREIRHFYVPRTYNFKDELTDLDEGSWKYADPENVLDFTAIGYFFAKELYDRYQIPIGLINSALGGSPVEAWISETALKEFPVHYEEAQRFKDDSLIKKIESEDQKRSQQWYEQLNKQDKGYDDPDTTWEEPLLDDSGWDKMDIPNYWADAGLVDLSGVVWFRKKIDIPFPVEDNNAMLIFGKIIDSDRAYINGELVGSTGYRYPPRRYEIPEGVLKEGNNIITLRVISNSGNGAFVPEKPYQLVVSNDTIDLTGEWKYRIGAEMEPQKGQTFVRWKPIGLYNAMIAPLINYNIEGVIWYQGESNAGRALEYRETFPAMINDWRINWQQGYFPFLFVQLANYTKAQEQPDDSNWALLRESQLKTLSLPITGMAAAYDIGEWNDIHPLNKKDVGKRLSLNAFKLAYGEDNVLNAGPIYKAKKMEGNKVIVEFENVGSGLISKNDDKLHHFAIAGSDRQFVWANARIEGDKVIVWSDDVPEPVAVRYAWADNPEGANLFNKEGLPASPFRTDNWVK